MPVPVVRLFVAKRRRNAALRRHRVRTRREHLGQHSHPQIGFRQLQGRAQPGAARTHYYRIKLPCRNAHCLFAPQNLYSPGAITNQRQYDHDIQRQPQAGILDVIHDYVTHADPRVVQQRHQEQQRRITHQRHVPHRLPVPEIEFRQSHQRQYQQQREDQHDHRGDALGQPVAQPVMGAYHVTVHHNRTPTTRVSTMALTRATMLLARAVSSSAPMCRSRNRWRMPASR